jgi:hypothetical protein
MKKPAPVRHCAAMRTAINATLNAIRPEGACQLCTAPADQQHQDSCPTWPIIQARAEYALDEEEIA